MTTTLSPFLRLPQEIIIGIVEDLSLIDTLRLSETCQLLHRLIKNSASIQYRIEREVAGVVDGNSSLSSADCLALLKKTEYNWATAQFSRMGNLKRQQGNLWELFGGMLAFSNPSSEPFPVYRSLTFIELPSTLRSTTPKIHQLEDLGTNIRDFGIDPTQDLLITIEMTRAPPKYFVRLLTISTGQTHPMASQPVLSCSDRPPYVLYGFVVQVMGDYLGLLLHTTLQDNFNVQDQFVLWNWKTGHTVLRLSPCRGYIRYDSFSFISSNHVVVSRIQPIPSPDVSPYLEIYEFFTSTDETIVDPTPYRTFWLPELHEGIIVTNAMTRSDPSPGCLGVLAGDSPRPFTTSPTSRLFTVCLECVRDFTDTKYVMFFIQQESLLSDKLHSRHPSVYYWDEWGMEYSRSLLLNRFQPTWVCYVHGTRFVRSVAVQGSNPLVHRLQVLDFNPLSIKRYGDYKEPNVEIVERETILAKNLRLFTEDVITFLPFRRSISNETYPPSDFMIDEDVVIGFRRATSPASQRDIMFLSV